MCYCADSRMLLTACDDMHAHLYDVEHATLIEAFSGVISYLCQCEQSSRTAAACGMRALGI